jgi:hypothetical protein
MAWTKKEDKYLSNVLGEWLGLDDSLVEYLLSLSTEDLVKLLDKDSLQKALVSRLTHHPFLDINFMIHVGIAPYMEIVHDCLKNNKD